MSAVGLVLTGGGARAAYQAGVIRGIAEITRARRLPFRVSTGVSAGAINAMSIAAQADDFDLGSRRLWDTWAALSTGDVFRTDALSIATIALRWLRDLAFGGFLGQTSAAHLLDTEPLRRLIPARIDFRRIAAHVRSGALAGVAVTATNYGSGTAVTFFDADPAIKPWVRGTRVARRRPIQAAHVVASSAIPLFFRPQRLEGSYYGDGCVRLTAPLSPAIHLGAERLVAIGIRHERTAAATRVLSRQELLRLELADVVGVLLNAVFLDSLETDLERVERINRTLALLGVDARAAHPDKLRPIPVLAIRPSQDLGTLASDEQRHLPATLRYMLRGLGADRDKGWDLISYLAFDSAYTRMLLELGRRDAHARADEIADFLGAAELGAAPEAVSAS